MICVSTQCKIQTTNGESGGRVPGEGPQIKADTESVAQNRARKT